MPKIFLINFSPFILHASPWHILHSALFEEQVAKSAVLSVDAQPLCTTSPGIYQFKIKLSITLQLKVGLIGRGIFYE